MKNPPAFPTPPDPNSGSVHNHPFPGMTLLDYFAGQAMQALAHVTGDESRSWFGNKIPDNVEDIVAKMSYKFAQAMLEEREKHL